MTVTPGAGGGIAPTPGADTVAATEDMPVQIQVGTLLANDTGAGRLTISGVTRAADAGTTGHGTPTLDAASGVVTFKPDPDYYGDTAAGHASFDYTLADSTGHTSTGHVNVNVAAVNDPPATPVDADPATNTLPENSANGTAVGITVRATDVDSGTVTYSFAQGSAVLHDDWFAIDPNTGVVTVHDTTKLDYETATSHQFTIYASDGSLTSQQTFTVTLTDLPENPPPPPPPAADTVIASGIYRYPSVAHLTNGNYVAVFEGRESTDVSKPYGSWGQMLNPLGQPIGGVFQIGADVNTAQGPNVAALANGGFAVVYANARPENGRDMDIQLSLYSGDGSLTLSRQVNTTNTGGELQGDANVVALDDGGFAVTWNDRWDQPPVNPYVKTFNADGTVRAGNIQYVADAGPDGTTVLRPVEVDRELSSQTGYTHWGTHYGDNTVALAGGGFLSSFAKRNELGDLEVYARKFNGDGTPAGDDYQISKNTPGDQAGALLVRLGSGSIAAIYEDNTNYPDYYLLVQRLTSAGTPAGEPVVVDGPKGDSQGGGDPVALADGGWVVAWYAFRPNTQTAFDIYGQRFDAEGTKVGGEFLINGTTQGSQVSPDVAGAGGDSFLAVWTNQTFFGGGGNIVGRVVDADSVFA